MLLLLVAGCALSMRGRSARHSPARYSFNLTEYLTMILSPNPLAPTSMTLDALAEGGSGTVVHVAPMLLGDGVDLARRLMELGFIPGERIRMLKRGMPGGDPLAVKVGNSTFALRRFEAALISIQAA
jgi:ferrous iron transport protein A